MLKITKTYNDFDGIERTETAYFNMTQSELVEMAMELPDNVTSSVNDPENVDKDAVAAKLVETMGGKGIVAFVKDLLTKSYGIRVDEGRRFKKSKEISEDFSQTMLFDTIFMELMSDDTKASEFINAIIPADVLNKTKQLTNN